MIEQIVTAILSELGLTNVSSNDRKHLEAIASGIAQKYSHPLSDFMHTAEAKPENGTDVYFIPTVLRGTFFGGLVKVAENVSYPEGYWAFQKKSEDLHFGVPSMTKEQLRNLDFNGAVKDINWAAKTTDAYDAPLLPMQHLDEVYKFEKFDSETISLVRKQIAIGMQNLKEIGKIFIDALSKNHDGRYHHTESSKIDVSNQFEQNSDT